MKKNEKSAEVVSKFVVWMERSIDAAKRPRLHIRAIPSEGFTERDVGFSEGVAMSDLPGERFTRQLTTDMTRAVRMYFLRELAKRWGIRIAVYGSR
jgi:hypothetical protein